MDTLSNLLHVLLPLLGIVLLVAGIIMKRTNFIFGALWICLIALVLHYQTAGGEILGTYFDYKNAAIYSVNLVILIIALLYLFFHLPLFQKKPSRYITGLISACLLVGGILLLINLWMNAYFIETRRTGTPIMQVTTFAPIDYCTYRYVFYKVGLDGHINYMCPNHYGVIPSIGKLEISPEFLLNYLTRQLKIETKTNDKGK